MTPQEQEQRGELLRELNQKIIETTDTLRVSANLLRALRDENFRPNAVVLSNLGGTLSQCAEVLSLCAEALKSKDDK